MVFDSAKYSFRRKYLLVFAPLLFDIYIYIYIHYGSWRHALTLKILYLISFQSPRAREETRETADDNTHIHGNDDDDN